MSYINWETLSGGSINPSIYNKVSGRGSGFCLEGKGASNFYLVNKDYINTDKMMITYSFTRDWEFYWHTQTSVPGYNGLILTDDHKIRIKKDDVVVYSKTLTPIQDKYGWYTPKINYEYDDESHNIYLSISYLNDEDVFEEVFSLVYNLELYTSYDRRIIFYSNETGNKIDDINIGVVA